MKSPLDVDFRRSSKALRLSSDKFGGGSGGKKSRRFIVPQPLPGSAHIISAGPPLG